MPELPEVETIRRELSGFILGKEISLVKYWRANLRYVLPLELPALFSGLSFTSIERRGKYLLFHSDGAYILLAHLGMSGNFMYVPNLLGLNEEMKHRHVDIIFGDGSGLIYSDVRRFGFIDFCDRGDVGANRHFRHMGIEPLSADFTGLYLHERALRSGQPIKQFLLDQRHVAGLGNIYVCESLWLSGISPFRVSRDLSLDESDNLACAIREILLSAISSGGSSMRDFRGASGNLGYFQHEWCCYGLAGSSCLRADCGGEILRIVQGGRSSFYCSFHQL